MLLRFPLTFTPMQDIWNIVFKIKAEGVEEF